MATGPRKRKARITRDGVSFVLGIGIVLHQMFLAPAPEASLLLIAAGLLGIPFIAANKKQE